jgi:HSP20 family protein
MDRLFDRFTSGLGGTPFTPPRLLDFMSVSVPAVDIVEDEAAFKLTAELPGLTEKDVDISISGNTLTVTGEKRQEREEKEKNYYVSERSYGQFRRAFTLPETVERDKIAAEFGKGVLTITLPKSAAAASKKIDVKATA